MIFSAGRLWVSIVPGLGLDFAVHPEIRFQKVLSLILIQLPGCGVCLFQVPGWTSLCIEINTSLILIQPPGCGVCLCHLPGWPLFRIQICLSLILIQLPGCGVCLCQVPGWPSLCIQRPCPRCLCRLCGPFSSSSWSSCWASALR